MTYLLNNVEVEMNVQDKAGDSGTSDPPLKVSARSHTNPWYCTALHLAVQVQVQRVFSYNFPLEEDHFECAYILTRHGIDIEMLNREGDSALDIVDEDFADLLERKFIVVNLNCQIWIQI